MQMQTVWSDRGGAFALDAQLAGAESTALVVASRDGGVAVAMPAATLWLVVRGGAEVSCREGRFELAAGDWLLLEREARPSVCAGSGALVLGLALAAQVHAQFNLSAHQALLPGRGRLAPGVRRAALRLWRRCMGPLRGESAQRQVDPHAFNQLLRLLAAQQADYRGLVERCPGRSLRRRRQVFARMQRARLFMEGHLGRPVRIGELAELSNVSVWYFTKTFHALYGEGPQAASARMRLRHAARLLRETRMSVSEVGAACGFENNCSFSRAFRVQFGLPPSLYRVADASGSTDAAHTAVMHGQARAGSAA